MSGILFDKAAIHQRVRLAINMIGDASANANPLADLMLYRYMRVESAAADPALQLFEHAISLLAGRDPEAATILRMRYLEAYSIKQSADALHVQESTVYQRQRKAIERLVDVIYALECDAQTAYRQRMLTRLEAPPLNVLVGMGDFIEELCRHLRQEDAPFLTLLHGLGGIGKTTIAGAVARRMLEEGHLTDIAWVSARQEYLSYAGAIQNVDQPALSAEELVRLLFEQLFGCSNQALFSIEDAVNQLREYLRDVPHLVVVDNLETVVDLVELLPILRRLGGASRFLLTSRNALHVEQDVYHVPVRELDLQSAGELIRQIARQRNLTALAGASDADLDAVYAIVGGNPLALRLVIGQTYAHSLETVLGDLAAARSARAENLYTYIYRAAWASLDETARNVLLATPLLPQRGGDLDFLVAVSELRYREVQRALAELVALNLVDVSGTLNQRRYSIHNLTRSFLQEQVIRW